MKQQGPELADVLRRHGPPYRAKYRQRLSDDERRVIRDIVQCRTPALGGYRVRCDTCPHTETLFQSCRNRHCPKCGAEARARWLHAQAANVLPGVPYFHVVFTVPAALAAVACQNKAVFFRILFKAVSETLQTIARDPKHLGAQIGCLAVLHTWSQVLLFHPHIHCIIPGGGLSPDGTRWIRSRKTRKGADFFAPVRVLSALFRGKILAYLTQAYKRGELSFHGTLENLAQEDDWKRFLSSLKQTGWTVYAKPPFRKTELVLKYLARYANRVAISNSRIVSIDDANVTFRWRDRGNGNELRTMTLEAEEFIRRFMLHVLPHGFQRIRHFGFLANCHRKKKLSICRERLGIPIEEVIPSANPALGDLADRISSTADGGQAQRCPACKQGRLVRFADVPRDHNYAAQVTHFLAYDTR